MIVIRFFFSFVLSCSALLAVDGTVPRSQASSYPSHIDVAGIGIGSVALKESEVKQRFATDLSREYLVAEIAIYPSSGVKIDVLTNSFVLHVNGRESALRPENPKVIASLLQRGTPQKRDVRVIPQATIGYESGSRYPDPRYDPTYDPRYDPNGRYPGGRGVYTSTGVGVVLGDSRPAGSPKDQDVMVIELSEKSLPSGETAKPVAGHLYFRVDKKTRQDRNIRYSLEFELQGKTVTLPLSN